MTCSAEGMNTVEVPGRSSLSTKGFKNESGSGRPEKKGANRGAKQAGKKLGMKAKGTGISPNAGKETARVPESEPAKPKAVNQIVTLDLNVWIEGNHILKNINIEIPPKKITAIIGPSGCGKTTLLKCMNRLIDLTEGARVEGILMVDDDSIFEPGIDVIAIRKKMGLLSQKPYPLPMSIYDNVAYGPRVNGEDEDKMDARVRHYIEAVGLWDEVKDRLKDPATKLSVGQQQRLCLARGLAVEPEVILCDEPTSALDPNSARTIEEHLKKLKEKYTIVLVTHVLRQAKRLADNVIFMYYGEVIEQGPASKILVNPDREETRRYIGGDIS